MVVEFIGAPGAGKTTLLPIAVDFFHAQGFRAYSVVEAARPFAARTLWGRLVCKVAPLRWQRPLLWQIFYHLSKLYRLKFACQHPRLVWMVVRFQHRRPLANADRRHVLHWFYHQIGVYAFLKAHAHAHEVLLFDEGFIHRVVQHYASENETPQLLHMFDYINLLPQPDLVICPVATQARCAERVYARGLWSRFRHKRTQAVARYLAHAHAVVQEAVQQIKRRGWTVLEINNDDVPTAVAAAELRRKLVSLPQLVVRHQPVARPARSRYLP